MAKVKKAKRDDRIVLYLRVKSAERARIAEIAEKRGHPHTLASVAAEMIGRGLAECAQEARVSQIPLEIPQNPSQPSVTARADRGAYAQRVRGADSIRTGADMNRTALLKTRQK
jgi:hypothetical protein